MTKSRLLQRVKALEEIVKPQTAIMPIPKAAQEVFDRIMSGGSTNTGGAYQGRTGDSKDTVRSGIL
jgi:hypothetical protein